LQDTEEREKGNELGEGGVEAIERISRQYSDAASSSDTLKGSLRGVAGLAQRKRIVLVLGAVSTIGEKRGEFARTSQRTEIGREGVTNQSYERKREDWSGESSRQGKKEKKTHKNTPCVALKSAPPPPSPHFA
jgi:hypothetical protein